MSLRLGCSVVVWMGLVALAPQGRGQAMPQGPTNPSGNPSVHHGPKAGPGADLLEAGSVSSGVYRNSSFGFSCKIPAGWVLRTEEMNAQNEDASSRALPSIKDSPAAPDRTAGGGCPHTGCGRVLLAAFARPPLARGEDVNSSIVIAAESASSYPGLKEAGQYLGPVTEIAEARGFETVNPPYEIALGAKTMARADFQKDVASRVMRQSTLVILARGFAVSFTFIGGTEEEVDELIDGLNFSGGAKGGANPPK
jgi:hypothetical protein